MRVLLIGGNGGLGRHIQQFLTENDHEVYAPGSKKMDVCDWAEIYHYVQDHPCDVLIYLAGVTKAEMIHKSTFYTTETNNEFDVNSSGFLNVVKHVLPNMRKQKFGRIIFVSSVLAVRPIIGTAGYSASKCYSESIVRSVALECATKGITANTIRLGYTSEGMIKEVSPEVLKEILHQVPMRKLGKPEHLYHAIKFVMNNDFLTGATIDLSGGLHL